MPNYLWVHGNGEMRDENHERNYYQLNQEDLRTVLNESMNQFHNQATVREIESNIFLGEYLLIYSRASLLLPTPVLNSKTTSLAVHSLRRLLISSLTINLQVLNM